MAEQLDMGRLNLQDSQHAPPNGFNGERSAYIPPHLRGRPGGAPPQGPPPMMNGGGPGMGGSAWGPAPGGPAPGPGPAYVFSIIPQQTLANQSQWSLRRSSPTTDERRRRQLG
jgi:hypothetical protein